jgi:hypothetical protein
MSLFITLLYAPTAFNCAHVDRSDAALFLRLIFSLEGAHHATAVLVDELDACGLQDTADRERSGGSQRLTGSRSTLQFLEIAQP